MTTELYFIFPVLAGFLLDALLGDPRWLPHPIRLFGHLIGYSEKQFNQGSMKKVKGILMAIILISITFIVFWVVLYAAKQYEILYLFLATLGVFYGLANRSLISEGHKVISVLEKEGIEAGRKQLSFIVGRETEHLNEQQIRTAVLETLAENLSDGVIAPLFYYALGGVPAMMAYKMANTLDSMVGYKNDRFKQFGWCSARIDDVLNFIPARLTAIIMATISISWRAWYYIFKFGHRHASPNSGYPEAAMAGILNCRFGGPNYYHGQLVNKPFIGKNTRILASRDLHKAYLINTVTCLTIIVLSLFIHL